MIGVVQIVATINITKTSLHPIMDKKSWLLEADAYDKYCDVITDAILIMPIP